MYFLEKILLILKQIFHLVIYPVLPIFLNNFLQVMQNHNQIFFSKKKTKEKHKQKTKKQNVLYEGCQCSICAL